MLTIYTDGSCSPNPGKGGWGFIGIEQDFEFHINGGDVKTTNNIMEMTAVMEAISFFKHYNKMTIYSDSTYVIKCATGEWKRKKNIELWEKFDKIQKNKNITWIWVRGHNGDKYNELVDRLANTGRENLSLDFVASAQKS